jgi:signal transduction histidine kinase
MFLPDTAPIFSCPQCHTPVRAGDTECRWCGINLALAGANSMRLSVRDTGIGISPERLRLIFEPFSQAADAPSQLVDGTGLGLVKRIVEAHDAPVAVDSQLGQGSTFSFELPLARPAAE